MKHGPKSKPSAQQPLTQTSRLPGHIDTRLHGDLAGSQQRTRGHRASHIEPADLKRPLDHQIQRGDDCAVVTSTGQHWQRQSFWQDRRQLF